MLEIKFKIAAIVVVLNVSAIKAFFVSEFGLSNTLVGLVTVDWFLFLFRSGLAYLI
jgi:hypothetical protein